MGLATGIRRLTTFCILVLLSFLGGCAHDARPPFSWQTQGGSIPQQLLQGTLLQPQNGTSSGVPVSMDTAAFLERAKTADYILIGEGHTVACDHQVQARLLSVLASAGMPVTVGLEMFPVDHQDRLDAVNAGQVPLARFADTTGWKHAWGYDVDLYRPVLETVYRYHLPLRALNVPQALVKKVSRGGVESLTEAERVTLPHTIIPAPDDQRDALQEMVQAHRAMANGTMPGMRSAKKGDASRAEQSMPERNAEGTHDASMKKPAGPDGAMGREGQQGDHPASPMAMTGRMDRFFLIQSLWDTAMAERAIAAREEGGRPVVVLIGAGHVEFGWGIAHRIRTLRPQASVLLLTPWRGTEPVDPSEADIRYFCRLTHQSRLGFTLMPEAEGVRIVGVAAASRAQQAGFAPGDLITMADGKTVDSLWVLHMAGIAAAKEGRPVMFTIRRANRVLELAISPMKEGGGAAQEDSPTEK